MTPLLRCDPRMGATTVSSMDGHIWRWAGNIPPGFEPEFEPRLAHYSKCYTYTWFGSALQNTYISSLGHDDASSVSFHWANACAVLPRPVSGAFHAERSRRGRRATQRRGMRAGGRAITSPPPPNTLHSPVPTHSHSWLVVDAIK